jgi:photosystem II stability/assembly factor-like uncharacterized protein
VDLLIGTSDGVFRAGASGRTEPVNGLDGRNVRTLHAAKGGFLAGADTGVFRSDDGGRSWELCGAYGQTVWDLARVPRDSSQLFAGTQPAALFRSSDGGRSWSQVEAMNKVPGAERWCVPNSPAGARARTIVIDRADPSHCWIGLEVGGVLETADDGVSWSCTLPGGNPDIHVMVADPGRPEVLYATTGRGRFEGDPEPVDRRNAGLYKSEDGGRSWRYLWADLEPKYTRPMCIDPRSPHALTVGASPSAASSHRDEGGAKSMLYQSVDGGESFRSLGDADHSPSAANILTIVSSADANGNVLVGTDTGEVWIVTSAAEWHLQTSGLPMVQAVMQLN